MLSRQFIKDNVVRFNRNVKRYMMPKKSSHITYNMRGLMSCLAWHCVERVRMTISDTSFIERIGVSAENSLFGVREKNW